MMNDYLKADIIAFEKADPAGKREMIAVAINGDDLKLNYSRECLLAMIKWQKELLAEAYDAFECSQLSQADKDVDLMRYIGLKDNYGTEICEDDIVEHFDGEYYFTGVVTYSPFGWYVKSKYDNISFEHFADETSETADCKVIGNIYETEKEEGSDSSEVYADGWPGRDREKIEADRRELRQAFEMIKKGLCIFHEIEHGEEGELDAD